MANTETAAQPIDLPPLPKCKLLSGPNLDSLHVLYTAEQMRAYAALARQQPAAAGGAASDLPGLAIHVNGVWYLPYCRSDGAQHAASGAGEVAASIDTPEFRALADKWQLCLTTDLESTYAAMVAHIDAQLARQRQAVPHALANFAIVPLSPTEDMIVAFAEEWYSRKQCIDDPQMDEAYGAMLAAAPAAPAAPHAQAEPVVPVRLLKEALDAAYSGMGSYHRNYKGAELGAAIETLIVKAAPVPQEAEQAAPAAVTDERTVGMRAAADFIEKRAAAYADENASTEPDTGSTVWNYGEAGHDYYNTLVELADDLRNASGPADNRVEDLSALVRQLVRSLKKASPDNELAARALDYLRRKGLAGNPLRIAQPAAPAVTDAARDVLADAKDAARYRWLRPKNNLKASHLVEMLGGEKLDAAIDAEMLTSSKEADHG